MTDTVGQAAILLLVLILPLSALMARGVAAPTIVKYAAGWIAVFLILWLIASNFT